MNRTNCMNCTNHVHLLDLIKFAIETKEVEQEFNYILEGTMNLEIAGNDIILNEGDSVYFDSSKPHGMKALNGKKVKFLAVII